MSKRIEKRNIIYKHFYMLNRLNQISIDLEQEEYNNKKTKEK